MPGGAVFGKTSRFDKLIEGVASVASSGWDFGSLLRLVGTSRPLGLPSKVAQDFLGAESHNNALSTRMQAAHAGQPRDPPVQRCCSPTCCCWLCTQQGWHMQR